MDIINELKKKKIKDLYTIKNLGTIPYMDIASKILEENNIVDLSQVDEIEKILNKKIEKKWYVKEEVFPLRLILDNVKREIKKLVISKVSKNLKKNNIEILPIDICDDCWVCSEDLLLDYSDLKELEYVVQYLTDICKKKYKG